MSVEARLERVERILEDLEARDGVKARNRGDDALPRYKSSYQPGAHGISRADPNTESEFKRAADEAKAVAEEARRVAEAGQRAAQSVQRNAEQAMRDIEKLKSKDFAYSQDSLSDPDPEAPIKELQALRATRESLERQIQTVARQIKLLEEKQKRQNKPVPVRPDDTDEAPKRATPAPEKTL